MTDEQALINKLREMEARYAGAPSDSASGVSWDAAWARILDRLHEAERRETPAEYRFALRNPWSMRLLMALLRRYRITPYRYRGQRHTTVMARVTKRFVDDTLWPEFLELDRTLTRFLDEVTRRVIEKAVCPDSSDVEVRATPPQLPGPGRTVGEGAEAGES